MKFALILAAAFALTTTAAMAQTVAPGTAPGAQTGNPSNMPSAGTSDQPASTSRRMDNMSGNGMSGTRSDKKMMHKGKKMKSSSDGSKMKTKM